MRHTASRASGRLRSFGAICVLATQSRNSLRYALGESIGTGEHAVETLRRTPPPKLSFRSTDGMAQERYVGDLCPLTPGRPRVADVRPRPRCGRASAALCSRTGGWNGGDRAVHVR